MKIMDVTQSGIRIEKIRIESFCRTSLVMLLKCDSLWIYSPPCFELVPPPPKADSGKEQILKEATGNGEDISGSGGNRVQGNLLGVYKDDPS